MRRRHRFSASAVVLFLTAVLAELPCAGAAVFAAVAEQERASGADSSPVVGVAEDGEPLPERPSELTSELVYAVLVAQVARQRGEHRIAYANFLRASQLAADAELAELAARVALKLKDQGAVDQAIANWLELAPESLAAHKVAAHVRFQAEDIDQGLVHLRRLVVPAAEGDSDGDEEGYVQAARLVAKLQPPGRRLEVMSSLTAAEPDNPNAWFAKALVAAAVEDFDGAVAASQRASELRPEWGEPRIFSVRVLLSQGKRVQARESLEGFVTAHPEDSDLRMLYAQLLVEEEEFAKARGVFEAMLQDEPEESDVLFALGILSLQLEDLDGARDYFTRLWETGQRRDDAAFYLGQVEEVAENTDQAISWYGKAEGEHAIDAQVRIARFHVIKGEVERAREILQQLRDQWPEDAVTLYQIEAELLRDQDLNREAMVAYDEAVAAFPENVDLLYGRALLAGSLNQLDILERDLNTIIERDPEHADSLNALGYTLADQTDRVEEALTYIKRAIELKPDDPAVLDSMGWVQYRLGNHQESVGYLRRAHEQTEDGEIAAHLGEVLWVLGERDEAWRVWEAALALDPDHEYLLRVIGRHRITRTDAQP